VTRHITDDIASGYSGAFSVNPNYTIRITDDIASGYSVAFSVNPNTFPRDGSSSLHNIQFPGDVPISTVKNVLEGTTWSRTIAGSRALSVANGVPSAATSPFCLTCVITCASPVSCSIALPGAECNGYWISGIVYATVLGLLGICLCGMCLACRENRFDLWFLFPLEPWV